MKNHFWKSKVLVALVIGLFGSMIFLESLHSTETLFSRLISQGTNFYENTEFDKAVVKFKSALALASGNEEMAEAYFLLSLTYYALVDLDNCKSNLENYFFLSDPKADPFLNKNYPPRFVEYFRAQKDEYQKKTAAVSVPVVQTKKETSTQEKTSGVKIEKKKKVWPWILLGAVGIGALLLLLLSKKSNETSKTKLTTALTFSAYVDELLSKYGLNIKPWHIYYDCSSDFGQNQEKGQEYYRQNGNYYESFDMFSGYFEHYCIDDRFSNTYPTPNGNIELGVLDKNAKRYWTRSYDYNYQTTGEGESVAFVRISNQYLNPSAWYIFCVKPGSYQQLDMGWVEESIVKYQGKDIYRMLKYFDGTAINPEPSAGEKWKYNGYIVGVGDNKPSSRWIGKVYMFVLEAFDKELTPPFNPNTKEILAIENGYCDLWIRTR